MVKSDGDEGNGGTSAAVRQVLVAIHERRGTWARQLRPRLADGPAPIQWAEARSAGELVAAVAGAACPVVVVDVGARPRGALEAVDAAVRAAPNALVLVLDAADRPEVETLARELGATDVLSGRWPPPAVADRVARWLPLARRRAEADGWSPNPPLPVPPWEFDHPRPEPAPPASPPSPTPHDRGTARDARDTD